MPKYDCDKCANYIAAGSAVGDCKALPLQGLVEKTTDGSPQSINAVACRKMRMLCGPDARWFAHAASPEA